MKNFFYFATMLLLANNFLSQAMDPKRSANMHNPLYNLVDDTPAIETPKSSTTVQSIHIPSPEEQQLEQQRRRQNYALFAHIICKDGHVRTIPPVLVDIIDEYYPPTSEQKVIDRLTTTISPHLEGSFDGDHMRYVKMPNKVVHMGTGQSVELKVKNKTIWDMFFLKDKPDNAIVRLREMKNLGYFTWHIYNTQTGDLIRDLPFINGDLIFFNSDGSTCLRSNGQCLSMESGQLIENILYQAQPNFCYISSAYFCTDESLYAMISNKRYDRDLIAKWDDQGKCQEIMLSSNIPIYYDAKTSFGEYEGNMLILDRGTLHNITTGKQCGLFSLTANIAKNGTSILDEKNSPDAVITPLLIAKYKPSIAQDHLLEKMYKEDRIVVRLNRHEAAIYQSLPKALRLAAQRKYALQLTAETP